MEKVTDRRIRRTRTQLHEALASLLHEKDYDCISVTEILDRANVGRSTFYTHYAQKDDLLVQGILEMLQTVSSEPIVPSTKPYLRIIRFSLPIFEHVLEQRNVFKRPGDTKPAMGPRGRTVLHEHLQRVLTGMISDEMRREFLSHDGAPGVVSPEVLARYLASTFVLVLTWWLEGLSPMSPKEIDAVFRALVLPTLESVAQGT